MIRVRSIALVLAALLVPSLGVADDVQVAAESWTTTHDLLEGAASPDRVVRLRLADAAKPEEIDEGSLVARSGRLDAGETVLLLVSYASGSRTVTAGIETIRAVAARSETAKRRLVVLFGPTIPTLRAVARRNFSDGTVVAIELERLLAAKGQPAVVAWAAPALRRTLLRARRASGIYLTVRSPQSRSGGTPLDVAGKPGAVIGSVDVDDFRTSEASDDVAAQALFIAAIVDELVDGREDPPLNLRTGEKLSPQRAFDRMKELAADGHRAEALAMSERALAFDAKRDETHRVRGELLLRLGRVDAAWGEMLLIEEASVDAVLLRGLIAEARGDDRQAEADYRAVLKKDPEIVEAIARLATMRIRRSRDPRVVERAKVELLRAYDFERRNPTVNKGLGLAYLFQQDFRNAYGSLSSAIQSDPGDWESWYYRARVRLLLASVTPRSVDVDEFFEDLRRAIAADPAQPLPYRLRAEVYMSRGGEDYARAAADLERILELRPGDPSALFQRGLVRLHQERYDASAADFQRVAAARPKDYTALYNVACVRARQGRADEALEWLEKAFAVGWGDVEHTAADPDLKSLRSDARFQRLIRGDRAD